MNADESKQASEWVPGQSTNARLWWSPTLLLARGVFLPVYTPQPTLPPGSLRAGSPQGECSDCLLHPSLHY